jgi:hypothetical protein
MQMLREKIEFLVFDLNGVPTDKDGIAFVVCNRAGSAAFGERSLKGFSRCRKAKS